MVWKLLTLLLVPLGLAVLFYKRYTKKRILLSDTERDIVIVHYKTPGVPEFSPFRLKLESYLRLTNIPYKVATLRQMSSKGKIPWMEYNGEVIEDSQFCIQYIKERFNVDLDHRLSTEQSAISRAFQVMVEENTFWGLVLTRWVHERNQRVYQCLKLSGLILWFVQKHQKKQADGHGIGKHTWNEIKIIIKKDLSAIAAFLGNKQFLFGRAMTEVDCSVFGLLAQFYWYEPDSYGHNLIKESYPILGQYCERVKHILWPDLLLLPNQENTE